MDKITTGKIKVFQGQRFCGSVMSERCCYRNINISDLRQHSEDNSRRRTAKPDSTVSAEQVDNTQSGIPKDEISKSEADSSAAPANNFVRSTAKRVMPIENEVIWEYSNGELVKSETLGVWKTHDGMDIAASVGTDVKAACTGKVKR